MMKIRVAIAREVEKDLSIEIVDLSAEDLGPQQVLVKVMASGICHTDLTARDIPPDLELPFPFMPKPIVLGHEGAGIVERVGSAVTHLKPGDRVLMSYHFDGECSKCEAGQHPYCDNYGPFNLFGTSPTGGYLHHDAGGRPLSMMHHQSSFASYAIGTAQNTHKIPDALSFEFAAPIGCGVMTGAGAVRNLLEVQPGKSIVVFGCGAVGLSAIAAAKDRGCGDIIAVDLFSDRLNVAQEAGATGTINASETEPAAIIMEQFPMGVDYTLDATGVKSVIETAMAVLGVQGKCSLIGATANPLETTAFQANLMLFGKEIKGSLMGHADPYSTIQYAIDLILDEKIPMDKMVKTFDFAEVNRAMGNKEAIKPVLLMNHDS